MPVGLCARISNGSVILFLKRLSLVFEKLLLLVTLLVTSAGKTRAIVCRFICVNKVSRPVRSQ